MYLYPECFVSLVDMNSYSEIQVSQRKNSDLHVNPTPQNFQDWSNETVVAQYVIMWLRGSRPPLPSSCKIFPEMSACDSEVKRWTKIFTNENLC